VREATLLEICKSRARGWLAGIALLLSVGAFAVDITVLPTEELQLRYEGLTHEFRCVKCQNNSIADSPAGVASDLRRDVKEQLIAGKSDDEIRAFMVARYGNFILFRPPLTGSTAWIWLAPLLALLGGVAVAIRIVRKRSAMVAADDSTVDDEEKPR
jgi:cytochrome c-type biogenesis protein CcmH